MGIDRCSTPAFTRINVFQNQIGWHFGDWQIWSPTRNTNSELCGTQHLMKNTSTQHIFSTTSPVWHNYIITLCCYSTYPRFQQRQVKLSNVQSSTQLYSSISQATFIWLYMVHSYNSLHKRTCDLVLGVKFVTHTHL
jgi:hypothetical protein